MVTVDMRAGPGHGDVLMAGPAMRALRRKVAPAPLAWALPPGLHELARWMDVADEVTGRVADGLVFQLDSLWSPPPGHPHIFSPTVNRAHLFARFLGVDAERLDATWPASAPPGDTIVLACHSAQANRTLHHGAILELARGIVARGWRVVAAPMGFQRLLDTLSSARAVVAVDSFPMHLAAAIRRPLVALMPTYPAHARLAHYAGPWVAVEPAPRSGWPPGEHADTSWVESLRPDRIFSALEALLASVEG